MRYFCEIILLAIISITTIESREFSNRIINGTVIDIREAPYQVCYKQNCGGSILSKRIIATAAHCIRPNGNSYIRAGSTNNKRGGQKIKIANSIMHPKYNNKTMSYDFGVLVLEKDLIFNDYVKPIPLAREPALDGTSFVVSGWGLTLDVVDNKLRAANVNQINFNLCKENYSKVDDVLDESMVCAGFLEGGIDACLGDSGGPLVFNKTLYGVVSWGRRCALPGFPGVYGNIPVVYDWFMSFVK